MALYTKKKKDLNPKVKEMIAVGSKPNQQRPINMSNRKRG